MIAKDLIEFLKKVDPNQEVLIRTDYFTCGIYLVNHDLVFYDDSPTRGYPLDSKSEPDVESFHREAIEYEQVEDYDPSWVDRATRYTVLYADD